MDASGETTTAVFEATVFLDYFRDMPDPRQAGKVSYQLDEVLLLALMAVLAGAEGFTDIARFGQKKIDPAVPALRQWDAEPRPSGRHLRLP